jgi:hypothetical protein
VTGVRLGNGLDCCRAWSRLETRAAMPPSWLSGSRAMSGWATQEAEPTASIPVLNAGAATASGP